MYLDELGPEHIGPDGTFTEFLEGKLVQSAEDPPDFVDREWVREPDILWRYDFPIEKHEPRRLYKFVSLSDLDPLPPDVWLSLLTSEKSGKPRMRLAAEVAKYADHSTGRNVRPANGTIAATLGITRKAVNRAMARMVADGWLVPTGKGPRGVIVYALTFPMIAVDAA